MFRSGGAGQTVHFHVKQGEAVSLSLGGQVWTGLKKICGSKQVFLSAGTVFFSMSFGFC